MVCLVGQVQGAHKALRPVESCAGVNGANLTAGSAGEKGCMLAAVARASWKVSILFIIFRTSLFPFAMRFALQGASLPLLCHVSLLVPEE